MNSLNGLLKGARCYLPTLVTTPNCRIMSPKKFSYGNLVNGAFALLQMWGKRLILHGAVLPLWAARSNLREWGKKYLWQLYAGTCSPLKCLSFRLFPNPWISPARLLDESQLRTTASQSGAVIQFIRLQTEQTKSHCSLVSLLQGRRLSPVQCFQPVVHFCKGRQGDCMKRPGCLLTCRDG